MLRKITIQKPTFQYSNHWRVLPRGSKSEVHHLINRQKHDFIHAELTRGIHRIDRAMRMLGLLS